MCSCRLRRSYYPAKRASAAKLHLTTLHCNLLLQARKGATPSQLKIPQWEKRDPSSWKHGPIQTESSKLPLAF
ncbi:Hypothetical predicted protein [Podarcis lilfordi]|uniref:Uncharacterized protein n=1 Tax=Podarcis lilfordi TaxID=74358 RepID=A0AA35JQP4_9SAUR|nr:Hypothetical predicted protein [Podarcis lilfordi]